MWVVRVRKGGTNCKRGEAKKKNLSGLTFVPTVQVVVKDASWGGEEK